MSLEEIADADAALAAIEHEEAMVATATARAVVELVTALARKG